MDKAFVANHAAPTVALHAPAESCSTHGIDSPSIVRQPLLSRDASISSALMVSWLLEIALAQPFIFQFLLSFPKNNFIFLPIFDVHQHLHFLFKINLKILFHIWFTLNNFQPLRKIYLHSPFCFKTYFEYTRARSRGGSHASDGATARTALVDGKVIWDELQLKLHLKEIWRSRGQIF
jgi:hypothetical protein